MRKRQRPLSFRLIALSAAVLGLSAVYWTGCGSENQDPVSSAPNRTQFTETLDLANPRVQATMAVQDRHTPDLMQDNNVVGTATGVDDAGNMVIKVYLREPMARDLQVESLDGIVIQYEVTGQIVAMKGGGGGADPKLIQTPPIKLGTSGGWRYDLANGYCCGGTLGALVLKGGTQYVLSNYHVLEADIVSGGNSRVATAGDPVIQPGMIDVSCNAANAQNVASLSGIKSLPNSNTDCAIASVLSGMVSTTGEILNVGTISATTQAASLSQAVKKMGRTTGLTRSSVSGLNATISVAYENECAGGSAFTKTYTGQIVISNSGSRFLAGGDSGSLMVQDITTNPRAVGLLFAGSSSSAIANPIGHVLSFLGATMVGN
ncbi:MAG: hypothetical protein SGI90_17300 [Candidatus Eisenbacteria bacterium]|nr:hypothetical protein [Candidatus Eisenbacteria bacterium]